MATATPPPVLVPVPVASPAPVLKPGYVTTEGWLSFLIALPGVILNSGLVTNAPELVKILTMAAAALSVLGYTTNRTSLKKAQLALAAYTVMPVPAPTLVTRGFARVSLLIAIALVAVGLVLLALSGCGATTSTKMSGAFATCAKADL